MSLLNREARRVTPERDAHAPLIALRNVEKAYPVAGGVQYVLRRVTLDISAGDFVTIMGPSGAGKSTLLAILGMLDPVFTGEFHFLGNAVHAMSVKQRQGLARQHIGFVFQQYHLLDDLTVAENLSVPLDYRGVNKSDRASRVADVLDRFQIVGKKDLYPNQLSGGQQPLVGIARAVIAEPALILADEPTGNLDSASGRDVMGILHQLHFAGRTIVLITHDADVAAAASRQIHIRDGRLVA